MTRARPSQATEVRLPRSGPRLWLLRLVAAVLAPLLTLGLLEAGLRIGGYGYDPHFALKTGDGTSYATNLKFTQRFFPTEVARVPLLFSFPVEKPAATYRVFVLGASAAQGYPSGAYSFARILEVMLERAYPATDFEVINTSITATNSHVVRTIADEVAGYDPDLFVVYLGNNEVIGPYGIGSATAGGRGGLGLIRAGIALRATRLGQAVHNLAGSVASAPEATETWGGMEMFATHHVASNDPDLERVVSAFAANLSSVCDAARGAGIPVLLCTVAVNDWDCAPFASAHRLDLTDTDLEAWDAAFAEGAAAEADGRFGDAVAAFGRAVALDQEHAELRYRLGRVMLAAGDTASAEVHVRAARDLDLLRFRTDTRLNEIVRGVAATRDDVHLVDAAEAFADLGPDLHLPRRERRFFEHVHFTFTGNYELARVLFPRLEALLPPSILPDPVRHAVPADLATCASRLNYTAWDEYRSIQMIGTLLKQQPFPGRYDHEALVLEWGAAFNAMREGMTREEFAGIVRSYEAAVAERPDDLLLRADYAALLRETGRGAEAVQQWKVIEEHLPPVD